MGLLNWFKKMTLLNKIGLIGSVASIVGLVFIFVPPNDSSTPNTSTSGNYSPVINSKGDVSYSVNIQNEGAKNNDIDNGKPNYEGAWNEERAFSLVWPQPRSAEYNSGHGDRVEKGFFISINGTDRRILLTSFYEIDCQGCQQLLSLFVFKKSGNLWVVEDESRDFMKIGREIFNQIADNIEVWHVGPNRFGIVFNIFGWYQGDTYVSKEIYSFIAGELIRVMKARVKIYFSGLEKEEAIREGYWFEKRIDLKIDQTRSNFGFFSILATYSSSSSNKKLTIESTFDGDTYPIVDLSDIDDCPKNIDGFIEAGKCL
ncbi:hypothetical protein DSCO28_38690 [Desulfosarcina ovata subsp. sediminis]|uniref:Uncharacterized protein n=1 Tax=Desulfosarcina ovata subsp. sediminis TaxID=885957 RepID=A0A5K7ZSW3_9BACT|nr:hypothetical protein [Desulfosarcina ovata]BBO83303.1 hypothetical protein DSCO28_38690 [Desulfosarcina ovata subsp. sediminis]